MPARPVQAVNAILVSGNPIYEEYELEGTMTYAYPGKLVVKGTAAYQCQIAGDDSTEVIGVLDVMPDKNLTTMYTDSAPYTVKDQVRVIRGDCVVMLRADHAATITVGLKVQAAPEGNVDEYATANADVGIAEEAFTGPGEPGATADHWLIVKLTNI